VTETSPAVELVDRLVARYGKKDAHVVLDSLLNEVPVLEVAALAYDWDNFWARPKQILPKHEWRSFGYLTARGTGKTTALSSWVIPEIEAGRARCIGLAAQNEDKRCAGRRTNRGVPAVVSPDLGRGREATHVAERRRCVRAHA
jgi:hypothetical protein